MRLHDKVALITGAASGIGKATAHVFARNGAKLVVADFDEELGNAYLFLASDEASFINGAVLSVDGGLTF